MKITDEGLGNSRIRQEHFKLILNAIRQAGQITRVELADATGLSKSTITRVIDRMLTDELVKQTSFAKSDIGRKALYLELCPSSIYCIGLNFTQRNLYGSIIDITMNICHHNNWVLDEMFDGEAFIALIIDAISSMLKNSGVAVDKIVGIGIGVPGLVNYKRGVIERLDFKNKLYNIELEKGVKHVFDLPLIIDNNANTRVLGEYWYGYGAELKTADIIYVTASEGVGTGVISGGRLIRGKSNMAAELGETVLSIDGSDYLKLEKYCSTYAIEDKTGFEFTKVCRKAEDGDDCCRKLLNTAAKALGLSIVNMLAIFDSDVVVMGGSIFDGYVPFYDLVMKYIKQFNTSENKASFFLRPAKDALYEAGVAALIYKIFFNDK